MNRILSVLTVVCMSATAVAQQPAANKDTPEKGISKEAIEILTKADQATKKVKSVRYNATYKPGDAMASRNPAIEGSVVLAGESNTPSFKSRTQVKAHPPGSDETKEFTAGTDGETYYLIDPAEKIVYADIDPAVIGRTGQIARLLWMLEFVHPAPFSDELNAKAVELRGTTKVGDEECYEIHLAYSSANQEATWFFSTKDYLPRRVDRHRTSGSGEKSVSQLVLTDLMVDPKFTTDPFKLVVPQGFKKTDDFAP